MPKYDVEINDSRCPDCSSRIVRGTCFTCGDESPIAIALELATALRDVLHEVNQDDPGDHEAHNAPRLSRAERHASSVVKLLRELK